MLTNDMMSQDQAVDNATLKMMATTFYGNYQNAVDLVQEVRELARGLCQRLREEEIYVEDFVEVYPWLVEED
jgi:hypothetical protein